MLRKKIFIYILACVCGLAGCQTIPLTELPKPPQTIPGLNHKIEKGETLWRIAKLYDVDLEELVKINHITDTTLIETGRVLIIPKKMQQLSHPDTVREAASDDFTWPVKGKVVAGFGQIADNIINKGLNITPTYDTTVVASRSGRVVFYHPDFCGYGKTIIIDHEDGFFTVYAGNSEVLIKIGDMVKKNNAIAKTENPRAHKDTFLHFEIRKGSAPQNPYFYLP